MNKTYSLVWGVVIAAVLLLPAWSGAADKIGFFNIREVMQESEPGKKAYEDFKKVVEKINSPIVAREAEIKKLKDELEKQRTILKDAALKEKNAELQKKIRDYQIMVEDANKDLSSRDQELTKTIMSEILKVVSAIGEREKYTTILDVTTVAYWSKDADLTKRIIEEFNKSSKPSK